MTSSKISIVLVVIIAGVIQFSFCQQPLESALYENFGSHGAHINVYNTCPDLSHPNFNFDNRAKSYCVSGLWIFYSQPNFGYGLSHIEYSPIGTSKICNDFSTIASDVSSARAVASVNTIVEDSFRLYEHQCFMGEVLDTQDGFATLTLPCDHASFIITGSSSWSIYEGDNYTGRSICISAPPGGPVGPRLQSDIRNVGLRYGSIHSVKKGCNALPSERIFDLQPISRSNDSNILGACRIVN
ncbi:unnamed protein product [Orchesella dallaii]|uniref:Uncharacterized protein n=1 Tax=Orchesella dallaii TaxID=48710 RepID=A0ABP1RJ58_9HEXA